MSHNKNDKLMTKYNLQLQVTILKGPLSSDLPILSPLQNKTFLQLSSSSLNFSIWSGNFCLTLSFVKICNTVKHYIFAAS